MMGAQRLPGRKKLLYQATFTFTSAPRYFIEAIDRTLGSDWFQVGEAAPGDRKVEMVENMIDMTRDALADVDTATGAQAQVQVQGESCQQDREV